MAEYINLDIHKYGLCTYCGVQHNGTCEEELQAKEKEDVTDS
jgi:hypothetical protein